MTLDLQPPHPISLAFVPKLQRDGRTADGLWRGRIEYLASDRQSDFASASELLQFVASLSRPEPAAASARPIPIA